MGRVMVVNVISVGWIQSGLINGCVDNYSVWP